jgi:hypothetical protein
MVWTGLKALLLLDRWRVDNYVGLLTQSRVFRLIWIMRNLTPRWEGVNIFEKGLNTSQTSQKVSGANPKPQNVLEGLIKLYLKI